MKKDYRTVFLNQFVKYLILNSRRRAMEEDEFFPHHPTFPSNPIISFQISQQPEKNAFKPKISQPQIQINKTQTVHQINKPQVTQKKFIQPIKTQIPQPQLIPQQVQISPVQTPLPEGFSLGRIDPLITDKTVISIECPGPGKIVLVKMLGRSAPTKIILTEQEIRTITETFSKYSKIPLIEGIFKAAIGNLVITAVISEFVGSRFIINKSTPYSAIA